MQLDDIEKKENLSTVEVMRLVTQLGPGELLECGIMVAPHIKLVLQLDINGEDQGYNRTRLEISNRPYNRIPIPFFTHHVHIQHARIGGKETQSMRMEDVINIFEIEDAKWQVQCVVDRNSSGWSMSGW
jgi:hypothetical protein